MSSAQTSAARLEALAPVVRAILVRKSGMSLRPDDTRADNLDALELQQDVLARVWERVVDNPDDIDDLAAYAASVTHNAWSDHLRRRYPLRASLKNRLRYFLGHQRAYALWNGPDGEPLAGRHGWQLNPSEPLAPARVSALAGRREKLPRGSLPAKAMEQFTAADWDQLLGAILLQSGVPVGIDDLVTIVASLLDLREDRVESLDDGDGDDGPELQVAGAAHERPEAVAETRSLLHALWAAIGALKPDYRKAYLLNLPGPGKMRADLEVFVLHGVASMTQIGAAIGLREDELRDMLGTLDLEPQEAEWLRTCNGVQELFALLWRHLPLSDAVIGRTLGLEPQQVINRRMLALRELSRIVALRPRGARR